MRVFAVLMFLGFAVVGRWMQLHPENIVRYGMFMGENTLGTRLFRAQVAIIGVVAVVGGIFAALSTALEDLTSRSVVTEWLATLAAIAIGTLAAVYVRNEAKGRPTHKTNSPYGWRA